MLSNIPCTFLDRRWMRAAKAWRCFLALPADQILAASLTALIDTKVRIEIVAVDGMRVEINPAFVVDVPKAKGARFNLVVETVYEQQATHGPRLTAMAGQQVFVTLVAYTETPKTPAPTAEGMIGSTELKGLHSTFFKSEKFWQFLEGMAGSKITSEGGCKIALKEHLNVDSCRHIPLETFKATLKQFNTWMQGRGA